MIVNGATVKDSRSPQKIREIQDRWASGIFIITDFLCSQDLSNRLSMLK
jgi:hypothetical protein